MLAAVVVNYRTPALTSRAVASLAESARPVDAVFVVDNGAGDVGALTSALAGGATILPTACNLGFAGGANYGVRAALEAGADVVLLVNSDAVVDRDCVARLEAALGDDVGIVGPVLLRDADPTCVESAGLCFSRLTGRMTERYAGQPYASLPRRATDVEAVSGCVALIRRDVFERVGLFDEELFFSFEDLDLCLRARDAGFRILCNPAARAVHVGSASIDSAALYYYAARNHLRLGRTTGGSTLRQAAIVGFNVAHALRSPCRGAAMRATVQGMFDHVIRRYGER